MAAAGIVVGVSAPGGAADGGEAHGGAAGSIGLELALLSSTQSGDGVSYPDERDDQSAACGSPLTGRDTASQQVGGRAEHRSSRGRYRRPTPRGTGGSGQPFCRPAKLGAASGLGRSD